jgi:hypothetical protein
LLHLLLQHALLHAQIVGLLVSQVLGIGKIRLQPCLLLMQLCTDGRGGITHGGAAALAGKGKQHVAGMHFRAFYHIDFRHDAGAACGNAEQASLRHQAAGNMLSTGVMTDEQPDQNTGGHAQGGQCPDLVRNRRGQAHCTQ